MAQESEKKFAKPGSDEYRTWLSQQKRKKRKNKPEPEPEE